MDTTAGPVSPDRMKQVLGRFPSGVVVVTAATPDGPAGFTCQSFASLSLAPPLVVFCPSRASASWPRIRRAGRFAVNILAAHQESTSAGFARSGADKFAGVEWYATERGTPVLAGVCAWVECALADEYAGGDHTIVVSRVENVHAGLDIPPPLLFHCGGYGRPLSHSENGAEKRL